MNTQLTDAIHNRTALNITYKDVVRAIEPHTYGVSKKGEDMLRAYEHGGGWKLFTVSGITNIEPNGPGVQWPARRIQDE